MALGTMATSLSKIVEASWVNSHQKAMLTSLLQTGSEDSDSDEDLSLSAQPQGTVVAYESASGGILDTIGDMQEKAEESLSSTRKDEMEAAHAFALLKQGLEDGIAVAKKQLGESTLTRSTTEEELHSADTALSETQQDLAADTKYLEELKQSCTMKATEWANRQKQAGEETAAITKAKDVLSEGVKVFLQVSTRRVRKSVLDAADGSRSQVVHMLRRMATRSPSATRRCPSRRRSRRTSPASSTRRPRASPRPRPTRPSSRRRSSCSTRRSRRSTPARPRRPRCARRSTRST